ncbi:hypothetical protein MMC18_000807 [Xylographa bjoerkii]|nr:hypothetical protein [Xylographa bjoerkii]
MAAAAIRSPIFHLFTSLAPELRHQIWHAALPDEVGPALYFYKIGGWRPQHPENGEAYVDFSFCHDSLDAVQVDISLFFVNREARHIALAWIHKHNIQIRIHALKYGQVQPPVFVSPFDPIHDALYVAVDKWHEFLCEPDDRCFQTDMIDHLVHTQYADVTRIAIPEMLFRGEGEVAAALADLIVITVPFSCIEKYLADLQNLQARYFGQLKVLFIMVNTPLDLQPVNNDLKMQPRWEFKNIEEGTFFWNHDGSRFDFDKGEHVIDEALYKLIETINPWLCEELVKNLNRSFEVRPVSAIRI